jgi:peptidyl-prolyl cis-trans isomerase A (cyclophilin A)
MGKFWAGAASAAVAICLLTGAAWGQSQSQTSKKSTGTTHRAATHRPAVHRSLLDPSSLNQKAPDTFKAKFTTTKGDFVVEVTRAWAPIGADRFYNLVKNGFYNNCELFRVVPGFVVQFGISGDPKISAPWSHANIPDDPVTQSNKQGTLTYATAGPNTRTTQVFVNLGDNSRLDGQGFAPFGQVVEGMDVIGKFDSEYDDQPTNAQGQIEAQGNTFLKSSYPNLDSIKTAAIVRAPGSSAAKKPTVGTKKSATTTKKPAAAPKSD